MAKKQGKRNQKSLVVSIRHVVTPNGDTRLSRALGILLGSVARRAATSEEGTNAKKKEPPCQAPTQDAPTGGAEESKSREPG